MNVDNWPIQHEDFPWQTAELPVAIPILGKWSCSKPETLVEFYSVAIEFWKMTHQMVGQTIQCEAFAS